MQCADVSFFFVSGAMHSRPRTMPITSSPTPTSGNHTLAGARASYTTTHGYVPVSNVPMSTTAQYTNFSGSGTGSMGVYPSTSAPSGYSGGRVVRAQQPYSSGPGIVYMYMYM